MRPKKLLIYYGVNAFNLLVHRIKTSKGNEELGGNFLSLDRKSDREIPTPVHSDPINV